MRRVFRMVPILALLACQGDTPTDLGSMLAASGQPIDAGLTAILPDPVVDSEADSLEFFVINPPQGWCASSSATVYVIVPGHWFVEIGGAMHADWCSADDHWLDATSGDEQLDLAVHFAGSDVCQALDQYGRRNIALVVEMQNDAGDTFWARENSPIQCPYL
jgi:hypothetical protein